MHNAVAIARGQLRIVLESVTFRSEDLGNTGIKQPNFIFVLVHLFSVFIRDLNFREIN